MTDRQIAAEVRPTPAPPPRADPDERDPARTLRRWLWPFVFLAFTVALTFKLFDFVWASARPLALLLAAIVLAEALAPFVDWLARHIPRPLAIGVVYLALLLIFAMIGWIAVPGLIVQTQAITAAAPQMIADARRWIDHFGFVDSDQIQGFLTARASQLGGQLVSLPFTVFSSAFEIIAVVFLSVYWLIQAPATEQFALSLCPARHREACGDVLREMGHSMGGYIRGTVLNAVIIGGLAYIGYLVIGLQYPLVLALVAGTLEVVPVLGPILAGALTTLLALTDSFQKAVIVLVFWIALEQLEGHIVTPNVMRSQTDVPQLLVLLALLIGAAVGGLLGALVAIPLSGALRVLVIRALAPALRRGLSLVVGDAPRETRPTG